MSPARPLIALLMLLSGATLAAPPTWLVTGDAPYNRGDLQRLARLLAHNPGADFMVHIGDIKSGGSPCDDAHYGPVAALFARQAVPLVFSPGDNDWTDCRRDTAGGHDPAERLAHLRELFYGDPAVLRLDGLGVRRPTPAAPEVFWFRRGDMLFVNWHVVGSYNNRYPRDRAAMAEYRERRAANHAVMQAAIGALGPEDRAVVVFQHANPGLGRERPHPGYQGMHDDLAALLAASPLPVLLVHGDTHDFRFDQPWLGRANGERLWRLEVPGYPHVAGVRVQLGEEPGRPFVIAYRTPDDDNP